jgi:hypothetical protein
LGGTDQTTAQRPSDTKVFVRPNKYELGRGTIVIYNWGGEADVAVDVSGVLHDGDAYEVHNVQALFGPAVVSGTYRGGAIRIPIAGTEPPVPLGRMTRTPPRTGPAFDVFLLTRPSR